LKGEIYNGYRGGIIELLSLCLNLLKFNQIPFNIELLLDTMTNILVN